MVLKPEEMILFRPVVQGGLGLSSVKLKSLACLIHTFIEMAVNPKYIISMFECMLYKIYVLEDDSHCLQSPPYYTNYFYQVIKDARASGVNVVDMTIRQWYLFLLKRELYYYDGQMEVLKPCRVERLNPNARWDNIWKNVHLRFLSSDEISFAWKLVHHLLPTEERVNATLKNLPSSCKYSCPGDQLADLQHCFFSCALTAEVGRYLLITIQKNCPDCTEDEILSLDIAGHDALIWCIVKTLCYCWNLRIANRRVNVNSWIAFLIADHRLMIQARSRQDSFTSDVGRILNGISIDI